MLFDDHFDLIVLFPSWDNRSTCVAQADRLTADRSIILEFTNKGRLGIREKNDLLLQAYSHRTARVSDYVRGRSENLSAVWEQLQNHLVLAHRKVGRPLKLLIDLSASPRFYSLGLLAFGIGQGLVKQASFLYSEAKYQDPESGQLSEVFTIGRWESVAIPPLLGNYDPEKGRHYHISLGFEGAKTLRVVTKAEPDYLTILFPDPGYEPEYLETTTRNNAEMLEQFAVSSSRIVRAPAGDAIAAWQLMEHAKFDAPADYNTYYVCCGTKPHSLALAHARWP